jgi:hypothetical protein
MDVAAGAAFRRFETRPDGLFQFRDDALNRLFARAAYRQGLALAATYDPAAAAAATRDGLETETAATLAFCHALTVSPEAVRQARKEHPAGAAAQPYLARAERFCVMPGGYRARPSGLSGTAPPSEGWWVGRPLMSDDDLARRVHDYLERGEYLRCAALGARAPGRLRFEQRDGGWLPSQHGMGLDLASCHFRLAVKAARNGDKLAAETYLCSAWIEVPSVVDKGLADVALATAVADELRRLRGRCPPTPEPESLPPFPDP